MKRVSVYAPCRIDLAGGTLDIPPLNILVPTATTVNLAINVGVEVTIERSADENSNISILDRKLQFSIRPGEPNIMPKGAELINSIHSYYYERWREPLSITTRSFSPPGAGLAASSALCTALVTGLSRYFEEELDQHQLVRRCLDLEARVLGTPAGYQDFVAATFGGLNEIRYPPGEIDVQPIDLDVSEMERHMLLVYSGLPHHSGMNNWEVFKQYIEGNSKVSSSLGNIGSIAGRMAADLKQGDLSSMPLHLGDEWRMSKSLSSVVSTKKIDALIKEAVNAGGAGKVCGAGGGGCVILWHDGATKTVRKLQQHIDRLDFTTIQFKPVSTGCSISTS